MPITNTDVQGRKHIYFKIFLYLKYKSIIYTENDHYILLIYYNIHLPLVDSF
jgi:hypothetical protein